MILPVKVCHLTSVHPPFDTRIFYKEANTLRDAGYNVILIVPHESDELVNGIKILSVAKPRSRFERMFLTTWRVFRVAIREKANVYHFHDPELLPVGLVLKALGYKVIYDVHEEYAKSILLSYYLQKHIGRVFARLTSLIEKFSSRFFDYIITATENILTNFSFHNSAIAVTNYPIFSEFIEKNKKNMDDNSIFKLIYVGTLVKEKGISEIVIAMEDINLDIKIKMILCGEFSPKSYQHEVSKLNGFEKVEYLGCLQPGDAWMKMTQANIGVICFHPEENHINAMPNKLFEYMAAGIPVIASNFPLWRKIIVENNCGLLVDPLNSKAIAKAITYLIENPELREQMGDNGRRAVLEKYSWEKDSKKLLKIYQDVLGR